MRQEENRPQQFTKKPVTIWAMRWTGDNIEAVQEFMGTKDVSWNTFNECAYIPTLEGLMTARKGDWIIKGVEGEFYPCKPSILEKSYVEGVASPVPTDDQRTLRDIEKAWLQDSLDCQHALQEAYVMGVKSIREIISKVGGVASPVVETTREVVYTGEVFDCPAQSVVEESCICKPNWGHRSFHIRAALADTRVVPEGKEK